jgi:hypothetical protein
MVADAFFLLANVVTVKFAELAPAGTRTLTGTLASAVFEDDKITVAPPLGAATLSVTVPVEDTPPTTLAGLSDSADSAAAGAGLTVNVAVLVTPA